MHYCLSLTLVALASGFIKVHLATAMSKPVLRVMPFSVDASPTVICRRNLSFVSSTRFHVIVSGSTSNRTNLQVLRRENGGRSDFYWRCPQQTITSVFVSTRENKTN